MPLTLGVFQRLSLKSALKLFSPFVCLSNMLREQKTSNHEDLGFPPHGSAAGPSLGPRPGHNQLLTGPQAGLAVFLFFIKNKSQTEAPKLPPPGHPWSTGTTRRAATGTHARPQQLGGGRRPLVRSELWAVPSTPHRLGPAGPTAGSGCSLLPAPRSLLAEWSGWVHPVEDSSCPPQGR